MKLTRPSTRLTTGALVLAAIASAHPLNTLAADSGTQGSPTAGTTVNAPIRFEGTDLRIGSLPPVTFHGFGSQGLLYSTDYNYLGKTTDGSGEFTELGLNVSMSPFSRTRVAVQGFAFDVGSVGNYEPMLDYALIDYTAFDALGIRAGRIRRPAGIYNHIQDIDLARTYVLLPQSVYDARWRDFYTSIDGGALYGNLNLGKVGSLSYEAAAGMTSVSPTDGGLAHVFKNALSARPGAAFGQVSDAFMSSVQLWWNTPLSGLRAGANMSYVNEVGIDYKVTVNTPRGPQTFAFRDTFNSLIPQYSLEYTRGPVTLQAEFTSRNNCFTTTRDGVQVSATRRRAIGWYGAGAYRFTKWFEAGAYYSEFYNFASDMDGSLLPMPSDGNQRDLALALRFDPKPWWSLKLEGHLLHGTALTREDLSNPIRNGDSWFMVAIKTTFSF